MAHYLARHRESRVAKAALISAVPPLMVKTATNPSGLRERQLGRAVVLAQRGLGLAQRLAREDLGLRERAAVEIRVDLVVGHHFQAQWPCGQVQFRSQRHERA